MKHVLEITVDLFENKNEGMITRMCNQDTVLSKVLPDVLRVLADKVELQRTYPAVCDLNLADIDGMKKQVGVAYITLL